MTNAAVTKEAGTKKPVILYVRTEDINVKRFRIRPLDKTVLVLSSPPCGVSR
jgi:hypothetical protein